MDNTHHSYDYKFIYNEEEASACSIFLKETIKNLRISEDSVHRLHKHESKGLV
jgi:hypothetical protein